MLEQAQTPALQSKGNKKLEQVKWRVVILFTFAHFIPSPQNKIQKNTHREKEMETWRYPGLRPFFRLLLTRGKSSLVLPSAPLFQRQTTNFTKRVGLLITIYKLTAEPERVKQQFHSKNKTSYLPPYSERLTPLRKAFSPSHMYSISIQIIYRSCFV